MLAPVLTESASLAELTTQLQSVKKDQDRALIREFCFGVCRWYLPLNLLCGKLLNKPLKAKDADLHALLLIGLYQLDYMRVPPHAAVSASVEAVQQLGKTWAKAMVNAVLRRFQREGDALKASFSHHDEFRYAHPKWLIERFRQDWPEHWQHICTENNGRAPMTLRVNTALVSRNNYQQLLQDRQIEATACRYAGQGLQLEQPSPVEQLPGFEQGQISVQDEAAQLAASLLQLSPGQRVLDACAAPGGKSCHMLELAPALHLVALDIDSERAARIKSNLQRLALEADVVIGDAAHPEQWWDKKKFDRILLDAPCSATGVIRRHPDIKLLRRAEDIVKLADLQSSILKALWPLLEPEGLLLYATCSVLKQENEDRISHFMAEHSDALVEKLSFKCGLEQNFGVQLMPQANGHDGFYYALIRKRNAG